MTKEFVEQRESFVLRFEGFGSRRRLGVLQGPRLEGPYHAPDCKSHPGHQLRGFYQFVRRDEGRADVEADDRDSNDERGAADEPDVESPVAVGWKRISIVSVRPVDDDTARRERDEHVGEHVEEGNRRFFRENMIHGGPGDEHTNDGIRPFPFLTITGFHIEIFCSDSGPKPSPSGKMWRPRTGTEK